MKNVKCNYCNYLKFHQEEDGFPLSLVPLKISSWCYLRELFLATVAFGFFLSTSGFPENCFVAMPIVKSAVEIKLN